MFNEPTCVIMVGLPGCGKSTYRKKYLSDLLVSSTDDYIESYAAEMGLTYNDVFKEVVGIATTQMNKLIADCIKGNRSFVVDQTNLSVKKRKSLLDKVPSHYRKIAIVFNTPWHTEWQKRLDSRPGKVISMEILSSMLDNFVYPTYNEAFDEIWSVRN